MLEELPTPELPPWLTAARNPLGELPIQAVLEGSVYYPACRIDGDPVKYLGAHFHSFVYVDYGIGRPALCEELETFRGYRVFASRPVLEGELVPQGWSPRFPAGYVPQRTPPPNWVKPPFADWTSRAGSRRPLRASLGFRGTGPETMPPPHRRRRAGESTGSRGNSSPSIVVARTVEW